MEQLIAIIVSVLVYVSGSIISEKIETKNYVFMLGWLLGCFTQLVFRFIIK